MGSNLRRTPVACGEGKSLCVRPVYGLWCAHSFNKPSPSVRQRGRWVRTVPDVQVIRLALKTSLSITGETPSSFTAKMQDGARLDIAESGLWGGRFQRTFVDVRVFNPHAASNRGCQLSACHRKHENTKKRAYERRIREVEHASFTPLVFSASGVMAREATSFYKRLASLLAAKRDQTYTCTITWLRCLLSFSLLRSAIQCIRGARSSKGQPVCNPIPCDVIMREALVSESP